jgi:hypothetical protein
MNPDDIPEELLNKHIKDAQEISLAVHRTIKELHPDTAATVDALLRVVSAVVFTSFKGAHYEPAKRAAINGLQMAFEVVEETNRKKTQH